ncbi:MAG: radical SAM protein, partial [Candidatus Jordarchaeaceae archaeon]
MSDGIPIILTADRTLMSDYLGGMFLGFSSCVPAGFIPENLYFKIFAPPVKTSREGAVVFAPYGLRKIEAALLKYGFDENEVMVVSPERLPRIIGKDTKVVGISETDPLGIGPATTTFREVFGGLPLMAWKFLGVLFKIRQSKFKPKIIVGGPGAWQLEEEKKRKSLGIDCVVIGEGEDVVPPLFEKAVKGESIPSIVYGGPVPEERIPLIRRPTICGLVEIARGCGRGCKFCTPTLKSFRCQPIDYILKEVEVNVRAGNGNILLHAEDVLRYEANGLCINSEAVLNLFKAVKEYPGVQSVEISHFALSSVATVPNLIEEISSILELDAKNWLSGQTGIETGSPRMIKRHMLGKCRPFKPEEWPETVILAFEVLGENSWV